MKLKNLIANPVTSDIADVIPDGFNVIAYYNKEWMEFNYHLVYKNSTDGIYAIQTLEVDMDREYSYYDRDDFSDSEAFYKCFYFDPDTDPDDIPIATMTSTEFSQAIENILEDDKVHLEIWNTSGEKNKDYKAVFKRIAADLIESHCPYFDPMSHTSVAKMSFIDGNIKKERFGHNGAFDEEIAMKIDNEINETAPNETPNRMIVEEYNPDDFVFYCNSSSVRPSGAAIIVGGEIFAFANYYLSLDDGYHEDAHLGDARFYVHSKGDKYQLERAYKGVAQKLKRWYKNAELLSKSIQLLTVFVEGSNVDYILGDDSDYIGAIAKENLNAITEEVALKLIKQDGELKMSDIVKNTELLPIIEKMLKKSQKMEFEGENPEKPISASYCSSYPHLKPDLDEIEDEG